MPRIADSELAANVRNRNRVNSERRRKRLAMAGKVQLLTWIPDTLRRELDSIAAARGEPVSETAATLLSLGLKQITTTTPATTTTRDKPTAAERTAELFDAPAGNDSTTTTTSTRDELMTWIGERLNEGLSGADVARQLNASGQRTASGSTFTGQNLLRDYRAWVKKTGMTCPVSPGANCNVQDTNPIVCELRRTSANSGIEF